jgi:hypothetical protein
VVLLLFALVVAKVHVSPFEFEYSGVTLPRFLRWETGAGWLGAFVAGLAMGLTAVATALSCPVLRPVVHLSVRPCCSKVCPHGSSYLSLVSIALAGFLPEWVLRSTGRYFILITFCNLGYSSECAEVIFLMRRPSRDDLTDRSWWISPLSVTTRFFQDLFEPLRYVPCCRQACHCHSAHWYASQWSTKWFCLVSKLRCGGPRSNVGPEVAVSVSWSCKIVLL